MRCNLCENEAFQRLIATLKNLRKSNIHLEEERKQLHIQINELNQQKSNYEIQLLELRKKVNETKEAETRKVKSQHELKSLIQLHDENKQNFLELKNMLESVVHELCKERQKRKLAQKKNKKIIDNIKKLTTIAYQLQPTTEQLHENEDMAKKLLSKESEWNHIKSQLENSIQELEEKKNEFIESNNNYKMQVEDRIGLIQELKDRLERRNITIQEMENVLQEKSEFCSQLSSTSMNLNNEINEIIIKTKEMKNKLFQIQNEYNEKQKKYKSRKEKFEQIKCSLQQIQECVQVKIKTIKEESNKETMQKINEILKEKEAKDEKIKLLNDQIKSETEEKGKAENKMKLIQEEFEKEKKQFEATKAQNENKFKALQKIIKAFTEPS